MENEQMVSVVDGDIVILMPKRRMNKEEALRFAAWIVALSDIDDEFDDILKAVRNS